MPCLSLIKDFKVSIIFRLSQCTFTNSINVSKVICSIFAELVPPYPPLTLEPQCYCRIMNVPKINMLTIQQLVRGKVTLLVSNFYFPKINMLTIQQLVRGKVTLLVSNFYAHSDTVNFIVGGGKTNVNLDCHGNGLQRIGITGFNTITAKIKVFKQTCNIELQVNTVFHRLHANINNAMNFGSLPKNKILYSTTAKIKK